MFFDILLGFVASAIPSQLVYISVAFLTLYSFSSCFSLMNVCISVRAGKSLSFFRISFSIFFYPERFSLCFSFVFLSIWFVCLVMIDAVLWTIWLLSVSFRGLPMFTLITLMALLAMSIASCTQACFLYFFPLLLLPTVLIYDLSWQGHFSPVIFLLFQMQLWVLVSSITMFFLAVISMTGGV